MPKNSTRFFISSVGILAINLKARRSCSPTVNCCWRVRMSPACSLPAERYLTVEIVEVGYIEAV